MCLSPVTIVNPSKYVSLKYRSRFLIQVPCGHCAQCATNQSNDYAYRSFYEAFETFSNNGFLYYDTLTYRPKDLPHLSDFFYVDKDFPCFNKSHFRNFLESLRLELKRKYDTNFSYFLATEYGTDSSRSHRPHAHLLLFVKDKTITPLELSKLVSYYWKYGRTDGYPYRGVGYVMQHNYIGSNDLSSMLRTTKYIAKYVHKSCLFDKEISRRIDVTMQFLNKKFAVTCDDGDSNWLSSRHSKRVRSKLEHLICQHHYQSQGFGLFALRDIDVNKLFLDDMVTIPESSSRMVLNIKLPTYYLRKIFYDLKEIDGQKVWLPNDLGIKYLENRDKRLVSVTKDRLDSLCADIHFNTDTLKLADYIINIRGRIHGDFSDNIYDRYQFPDLFNYSSQSDIEYFDGAKLSRHWCGNSKFYHRKIKPKLSLKQFIRDFVLFDKKLESIIEYIYHHCSEINTGRQRYFENLQRLENIHKQIFCA